MERQEEIINRVAKSPLTTLDLADYYHKGERLVYDIKDNLYQGVMLREKEFRSFLKEKNWEEYKDKNVAITCSVDAIVPTWAYMLLASKLSPHAHMVVFGDLAVLDMALMKEALGKIDLAGLKDAKVVVKGCGDIAIPEFAFVEVTRLLTPHVTSLMYGEPCSTVPVYKKPKT